MTARVACFRARSAFAAASARSFVAAGVTCLTLGCLTAFAPANPSTTAVGYILTSGSASFSSGGHTWQLRITADGGNLPSGAGPVSLTVTISTPHLGGTEEHSWTAASLPARDLSVAGSGHAIFRTGAKLSPVVIFALTFTPAARGKASCTTGTGTQYSGTLAGLVRLKTGLKGVGVSRRITFGKTSTLEVSEGCVPPQPCALSGWSGGTSGPIAAVGTSSGRLSKPARFAGVERFGVRTRSPALVRTDYAFGPSPAPKFSASGRSLTIAAATTGIVTGRGVLDHALPTPSRVFMCYLGKQKYTDFEALYEASFHARKPFQARTILTGIVRAPRSGSGYFTIETLRKA